MKTVNDGRFLVFIQKKSWLTFHLCAADREVVLVLDNLGPLTSLPLRLDGSLHLTLHPQVVLVDHTLGLLAPDCPLLLAHVHS